MKLNSIFLQIVFIHHLLLLSSITNAIYGPPPLNYKNDVTSVLGVNTHNLNPTSQDLDLIQEAGIRWIRDDVGWQQVEKVKGEYDFTGQGFTDLTVTS